MSKSVLIVCTSRDKFDKDDLATGCWMEEVAAPYYAFKAAGYDVKIASVEGGEASTF
jgi:putative intracellular protease/amidase